MHAGWLVLLLVASTVVPAFAEVEFRAGARLVATFTNETGETSTAALRVRRCGRYNDGRDFCKGRYRRCIGPACRRILRSGRVGVYAEGRALTLTRSLIRCQLILAEGSAASGTYSCQYFGEDGVSDDYVPYDRGTFVLTEAPPKH